MKQDKYFDMRLVHVNVYLMQVFVITGNAGIQININKNAKNWLVYVTKDLFGILVYVIVNAINHGIMEKFRL